MIAATRVGTAADGRRARIVHVSTVHRWDDIRIFRRQCRSLARHGYEVNLIAVGEERRYEDGVTVIPLPGVPRVRRLLTAVPRGLWLCWRHRADLYHLHDPELIPLIPLLRLRGARVVYDAHEDLPVQVREKTYLPWPVRAVLPGVASLLCRFADRVGHHIVAATPAIARRFAAGTTTILHNYPEPLPEADGGEDYDAREDIAIYVGGITAQRGAAQMVDAMAQSTLGRSWRLVLLGPEPPATLLADLRSRTNWDGLDYRGRVPANQARQVMGTAKIGMVLFLPIAAHTEALPSKIFEYMAAGLPIIASDFPLWRSIIEEAGCGLVVDPTDPAAIAAALDTLMADQQRAAEMGRRGRAAAQWRYNWLTEEAKLVEFYGRLLRDPGRGHFRASPVYGAGTVADADGGPRG